MCMFCQCNYTVNACNVGDQIKLTTGTAKWIKQRSWCAFSLDPNRPSHGIADTLNVTSSGFRQLPGFPDFAHRTLDVRIVVMVTTVSVGLVPVAVAIESTAY